MSCLSASSVHVGPLATPGTGSAAKGPPVVSVGLDPDHTEGRGAPEAPGLWQWELHLCSTRRAWEARQGTPCQGGWPQGGRGGSPGVGGWTWLWTMRWRW